MSPRRSSGAIHSPTPELLERVAVRFRALSEPARLAILHALGDGELSVTDLVEATGLAQGNLSKHLQVLYAAGLVARRREGLFIYYDLADGNVLKLCELVCGRMERETDSAKALLGSRRG